MRRRVWDWPDVEEYGEFGYPPYGDEEVGDEGEVSSLTSITRSIIRSIRSKDDLWQIE
jgi:hypothetical protein